MLHARHHVRSNVLLMSIFSRIFFIEGRKSSHTFMSFLLGFVFALRYREIPSFRINKTFVVCMKSSPWIKRVSMSFSFNFCMWSIQQLPHKISSLSIIQRLIRFYIASSIISLCLGSMGNKFHWLHNRWSMCNKYRQWWTLKADINYKLSVLAGLERMVAVISPLKPDLMLFWQRSWIHTNSANDKFSDFEKE